MDRLTLRTISSSLQRGRATLIAFNNAGASGAIGSVVDISEDDWRETVHTRLTSAFLGAKHQVPAMIERGVDRWPSLPRSLGTRSAPSG